MRRMIFAVCVTALTFASCGAPAAEVPATPFETVQDSESTPAESEHTTSLQDAPSVSEPDETAGDPDAPAEEENVESTDDDADVGDKPPVAGRPVHPGPVAFAIADLADRLGVDESTINVVAFQEVTWPDGSLGCPDPKKSYTQALVNGSLIVLEIGGRNHEYHSGLGGDPFYCATPTSPVGGGYGDI